MAHKIDMTGMKIGKLVVIDEVEPKDGRAMWRCKCDCGNEVVRSGKSLRSDRTKEKSCGHCGRPEKVKDETGNRYGHLIVLRRGDKNINGRATWVCRCDCGTEKTVGGYELRNGEVTTCGKCKKVGHIIDETGNKYGHLTVLRFDKTVGTGIAKWICQCDCGTILSVRGTHLREGHTTSCGCIKSKGENKISTLLAQNNISFEIQKTFDNCRFYDTNALAKFDFYINNKYLIEFDGEQHFTYRVNGWDNYEHYQKVQERDKYKNQWCKENNIPLIRIPYTHLNNLSIEDLLLETSQFIV